MTDLVGKLEMVRLRQSTVDVGRYIVSQLMPMAGSRKNAKRGSSVKIRADERSDAVASPTLRRVTSACFAQIYEHL